MDTDRNEMQTYRERVEEIETSTGFFDGVDAMRLATDADAELEKFIRLARMVQRNYYDGHGDEQSCAQEAKRLLANYPDNPGDNHD